jgi:ferrous iron transport protein B
MTLKDLEQGQKGIIKNVLGTGAFRKRITEMGFVKGKVVTVVKKAPLQDPVEYNILGYEVSLRDTEAQMVEVHALTDGETVIDESKAFTETINGNLFQTTADSPVKVIDIALVGNPNSGKTTLFNFASHSHEHVGNYPGVTVDFKQAKFNVGDYLINIIDLPGTYSLTAYSPEELYVRKYILGHHPDILINVVDGSNLERNLYLTTQLIDMNLKIIVALNMYDELQQKGDKFDYETLGKMIGIPFVPTVGAKGKGIPELFQKAIEVFKNRENSDRHVHINYGSHVENSISIIQQNLKEMKGLNDPVTSRFYAIKLLEKDQGAHNSLSRTKRYDEIVRVTEAEITKLETALNEDSETLVTDARYGFIHGALKETYIPNTFRKKLKTDTEVIDTFITHKIFGFPIFILFLWIMFETTFRLGAYPQDWIQKLVVLTGNGLNSLLPDSIIKDLLVQGIINGVGGVIVFLPNILILFFFISFMEDTGYMARAAFIMDKLMHKIGLHGKSFIPLIMGFGCNVPAIMSARTIENRNDRLLTILINPFMSCSARLPVYILIIGAFFKGHEVTTLFSVYAIGILFAIFFAILFKKTIFRSAEAPFVMELPPYRIPTLRTTLRHMWTKGSQYLKKMGGVILLASLIIWALGYFPMNTGKITEFNSEIERTERSYQSLLMAVPAGSEDFKKVTDEKMAAIDKLKTEKESYRQEKSLIGRIGKFIEPAMRPLGFDWKMSVSLLAGVAAKEVVVSTMSVLYQADQESGESLQKKLQTAQFTDGKRAGQPVFNKVTAFAYLMFILLYFPCIAVVAAVRRESSKWKWAVFMVSYTTTVAWVVGLLVNQVGKIL